MKLRFLIVCQLIIVGMVMSAWAPDILATPLDGRPLLAAKKKKKSRRQAEDNTAAFESESPPFKGEFGLMLGSIDSSTGTRKGDEGSETESKSTSITLYGQYLFIVGKFGIGPQISYSKSTSESDLAGSTSKSSSDSMSLGALGKYYFGNLGQDKAIPFGLFGFSVSSSTSKFGESSTSKSSGTTLTFGGGLAYFINDYIALNTALQYMIDDDTRKTENQKTTTKENSIQIVFGLGVFH